MELDVHLTRDGEEPWGFEFVGGTDSHIPLTIDKVHPSSPAQRAGLLPGDVVARLGDRLASELSLEAAHRIVAEAIGSLSFGICRGLYDPVLDDFEPIYEPIERADSDLRSEPTEVHDPSILSLDDPNILDPRISDPNLWDSGYGLSRPVTETRSLTESPFVPNTKPYRPFSTDPLEVPPLDDPIILDPNYKDTFNFNNQVLPDPKDDDLLRILPLDRNIEPKFKLPISEKYDPDYDRKVKELLEKCAEGGRKETQLIEKELVDYSKISELRTIKVEDSKCTEVTVHESVTQQKCDEIMKEESVTKSSHVTKDEVKFEEIEKNKFDVDQIKQTALEVVEESIERAVSVTEDIKQEIEEELRASVTRELQNKSTTESHLEEAESKVERNESVTKQENIQIKKEKFEESKQEQLEHTEKSELIQEQLQQDKKFVEQRKLSIKKEIEDNIETGNVSCKSSIFEKKDESHTERKENDKNIAVESISAGTVKRQSMAFEKEEVLPTKVGTRKVTQAEDIKSEYHHKEFKSSGMFNSETLKSEGKQKAYMIGLQTIPHIKGFVQSSYHFDLLLRTFFVHLTDVMVALSRFILTQPTQELETKAEKVVKEKLIREFAEQGEQYVRTETEQRQKENKQAKHREDEEKKETKQQHEEVKKSMQFVTENKQENKIVQAQQETKIAKIETQLQQNQKVAQEIQHNKEDLTKSENLRREEILSHHSEEMEMRRKTGAEMAQRTQRKSKDLTQKMDAVITEFENKTGIEDRLEATEERRRRSRSRSQIEEEVLKENDPLEWLDMRDIGRASQERTATKFEKKFQSHSESRESKRSEISKHESRTTRVEPGKQMYVAIVESHVYTNKDAILEEQVAEISETASVQSSEEINAIQESFEAIPTENVAMSNFVSEEKQQAVEIITNALEEVVQEKQEILNTVTDFQSKIKEIHSKAVTQELHTSAAAVEFEDISLETTKEVVETKAQTYEAVSKQDLLESVAAETTEIVEEAKLEKFESEEIVSNTAIVSSEENYKATAQSTKNLILEASKEETKEFKVEEEQPFSKVESLAIAVAQSTDVVVDDSKLEKFESQEFVSEKAKLASEETYKTAAVEVTDITFETAEEKHSEVVKISEAKIKEEAHLAVAGIIETKTKLCKEPKKQAEDESASLKIVKYEIVNGGESTEVVSESELNVKQSYLLSSQHVQSVSESSYQSMSQETTSVEQSSSLVQESSLSVEKSVTSIQESAKSSNSIQESLSSVQESSFTVQASSISQDSSSKKSLHLDTNLSQYQLTEGDENNNTPTPTTQPPTPLTDEYVFKLEIPLPKNSGTVIIEESPDREDPHIVKKGLVPHIETTIEDQIVYDPPLPTPPADKVTSPVYTKPGLRGGAQPMFRREYIREIERKSSLLASAIDETIKSIEEYKEEIGIETTDVTLPLPRKRATNFKVSNGTDISNDTSEEVIDVTVPLPKNKVSKAVNGVSNGHADNGEQNGECTTEDDAPPGFKPVVFNPEAYQAKLYDEVTRGTEPQPVEVKPYVDASGEPLGTVQGIVDGLEDAVVDEEVAKELGKPGLTEDTIAVLISGESEMLREAHVMGLSRVLKSHMTRPSSVDFQKIKPLVPSLKDSEVIKLLNEEMKRECEEKKKKEVVEAKKWTTFLQKPKRPVPRAKHGYPGYVEPEPEEIEEPYKVKIVKQPKPKVAPDYKPEDFDTGPLPWEQRALLEPVPSPLPPEEPILVPETAEYFEAVDPLPESEVPDLEYTGIPLPPTPPPTSEVIPEPIPEVEEVPEAEPEVQTEEVKPPTEEMNQDKMAEQLVNTVKGMVDPNAPLEQQLAQMRAQLAALAQLPCVIQQSLEVLTKQLSSMSRQETHHYEAHMNVEARQEIHESTMPAIQEYQEQDVTQNDQEITENGQELTQQCQEITQEQREDDNSVTIVEVQEETASEEAMALKREQEAKMEEQRKNEKEKKEKARLEQEARQLKQRAPRVGKPRPVFGPLTPEERPLVLPGGRRWRGPKDAYNDQFIAETLTAQSEIIQGKVMGYESDRLPYDSRINFMKYEKPPVSLDHLENSPTYKLIHNMEDAPLKRTDLLTPVVAEADYRERCRSATPNMQAKVLM